MTERADREDGAGAAGPRARGRFLPPGHDHAACVATALAEAEKLCARRAARLTPLRRAVLELVWASHAPVGAYDILSALRERRRAADPEGGADRLAPPTVYRALAFLQAHGLVHRIESRAAYVGCPHPQDRHAPHFLICRDCGLAAEIDDPGLARAVGACAERIGFVIDGMTLEMTGRCPDCAGAVDAGHGDRPG